MLGGLVKKSDPSGHRCTGTQVVPACTPRGAAGTPCGLPPSATPRAIRIGGADCSLKSDQRTSAACIHIQLFLKTTPCHNDQFLPFVFLLREFLVFHNLRRVKKTNCIGRKARASYRRRENGPRRHQGPTFHDGPSPLMGSAAWWASPCRSALRRRRLPTCWLPQLPSRRRDVRR